ncbi:MAG: DegV family protein [Oscillospiraceae bacterium]|nr:DegV family protein [Oscillospiraceae bacterium]
MITIVTDSSSYFKKKEALDLGIRVVPINYSVNGQSYSETYSDMNGDFESLLRGKGEFTTSHPNVSAFLSCFDEEIRKGNEALCITISSRLSGAYSTAFAAAGQSDSGRIGLFDSQLTAGGLYILIKETKKLIDSGLSLHEVLKELPAIRDKICIAFSVDDMAPLRKSGRIGFVRMSFGTLLNTKPILLCKDGAVVSDSIARGNAEVIKKLVAKIGARTPEVVISYIGDNRLATNLYSVIKNAYPGVTVTLQKIGPVLGIHLGLKVIAISFAE